MSTAGKVFLAGLVLTCLVFACGAGLLTSLFVYPGVVYGRPGWEGWGKPRGVAALTTSETNYEITTATDTDTTTTTGDTGQDAQAAIDTTCRDPRWLEAAIEDTKDVATLIATLDRDFRLDTGGQWSEPGYAVPANSVFWSDLFGNVNSLPADVVRIRIQGGWGVYMTTSKTYTISDPNGGGRWMKLCSPLRGVATEITDLPERSATTADTECLVPDLNGLSVNQAIDVMDQWFEGTGYLYGKGFDVGDQISSGAVFWTNLGEDFNTPSFVSAVNSEGNWGVFHTTGDFTSPSGGRLVICN